MGCESASVDWLEKNERDVTDTVTSNQGQRGRVATALDSSPGGPEFECRSHHYLILGHSNTSFKSKATLYNFELASVAKSIRSPYCRLKFTS